MNKQEAAKKRVEFALDRMVNAQETLDEALRALSAVVGVAADYKQVRGLSDHIKSAFYTLSDKLETDGDKFKLDHEPSDKNEARYALPVDILINEEKKIERDQEIKIWDVSPFRRPISCPL